MAADAAVDTVLFFSFFHAGDRVDIAVKFWRLHLKTVLGAVFHAKTAAGAERCIDLWLLPFGLRNLLCFFSVIIANAALRTDLAADAAADAK